MVDCDWSEVPFSEPDDMRVVVHGGICGSWRHWDGGLPWVEALGPWGVGAWGGEVKSRSETQSTLLMRYARYTQVPWSQQYSVQKDNKTERHEWVRYV